MYARPSFLSQALCNLVVGMPLCPCHAASLFFHLRKNVASIGYYFTISYHNFLQNCVIPKLHKMGLSAISYGGMLMGNKGKGKVTAHATMMYGNRGTAPLINLCTRSRQVVSFMPQQLLLWGNSP